MADWSVIRTALERWVVDRTGLPVSWRGRPAGRQFSDAHALLSISAIRTRGLRDDIVTEDDGPAGAEVTHSQVGWRSFTFECQVRSHRQSNDVDALHYTTLLRDSVRLPTLSAAVFDAAGIAFASILSEIDMPATLDGRDMSVAQIDILFNATSEVTIDTPTTYVDEIVGAVLESPDGTPVWTGDLDVG